MNSVTFTLPWIPILGGLGVICVFLLLRKGVRGIWNRREVVAMAQAQEQERIAEAGAEIVRVNKALFPHPWYEVYERCRAMIDDNPGSRVFLREWLRSHKDLPLLSSEAVNKLACELTFQYCTRWDECLDILAPYDCVRLAREEEKNKALFPYPWNEVYEACKTANTCPVARAWLRKWIEERSALSEIEALPSLSIEAIEKLVLLCSIHGSGSEEYGNCLSIFVPYMDTGYSLVSDYNLKAELPQPWFKFWEEIKDYPERRTLFLHKMSKVDGKEPHPVTKVSLTAKQAALLARAFGSNRHASSGFYASDLSQFVVMEEERAEKRDETACVSDSGMLAKDGKCLCGCGEIE